jgi:hypothetical protein
MFHKIASRKTPRATRIGTVCVLVGGALALQLSPAQAQSSTCQTGFQGVMSQRQVLLERINGFRTKRPTAQQACSTLNQLVASEGRLIKWMTENKDWCSIPDETIAQARVASSQANKARGQTCTAASRQAQGQANAARQRAQGPDAPPAVGSGVRLPQGAL